MNQKCDTLKELSLFDVTNIPQYIKERPNGWFKLYEIVLYL